MEADYSSLTHTPELKVSNKLSPKTATRAKCLFLDESY